MPMLRLAGLDIHHESAGSGPALVLVHGSWDDLHTWDAVRPHLERAFTVVRYDRRGHGRSGCPPGQGRISQDVDDLAEVVSRVAAGPAFLLGHSYGASVALLLGARRPELVRALVLHEPPLYGLLAGTPDERHATDVAARMAAVATLLAEGEVEEGARRFVEEVAYGPGGWETLLDDAGRARFLRHADTWLDQSRDPERLRPDPQQLAGVRVPVLLTAGGDGLPWYRGAVRAVHAAVPGSTVATVAGAAHGALWTHPERLAGLAAEHFAGVAAERPVPGPGSPPAGPVAATGAPADRTRGRAPEPSGGHGG
ncbi:MAG TPA: alpha/beta fold hydrolase [Pseudonocardia sp.]|jgi:pimeloyl-ACP methyl ester carboxylesterase